MSLFRRKYMHVKQQDSSDCGVACVCTLLSHYGQSINRNNVSRILNTNKFGTKAINIIHGLNKLDFETKSIKITPTELFFISNEEIYPCIASVKNEKMDHYIVLHGIRGRQMSVSDPAENTICYLDISTFIEKLSGILILAKPALYQPKKINKHNKKYKYRYARLRKLLLILMIFLLLLLILQQKILKS